MKPQRTLLIAVAVGVLGIALGYALRMATELHPTPTTVPTIVDTNAPAQPESPTNVATRPPERKPEAVAPSSDALAEWLKTLEGGGPTRGSGRIHGKVAYADGTGVSGVRIKASPHASRDASYSEDEPVETSIERAVRRIYFSQQGELTTVTDDQGRYVFEGLGAYEYRLYTSDRRFELKSLSGTYRVKPDAEINYTATPMITMSLDIRLPDGTAPESANVSFVAPGGKKQSEYWTPSRTSAQVRPGEWEMAVIAGEHNQYTSDPIALKFALGDTPAARTIHLKAICGVHCRVVLPFNAQYSHTYAVFLERNPGSGVPTSTEGTTKSQSLSHESRAVFLGLEPGQWRAVVHLGKEIIAWQDFELSADEFREIVLKPPEPQLSDHIPIRIFAPDGNLLRNASFDVDLNDEKGRNRVDGWTKHRTIRRADGTYWVPRTTPDRDATNWVYVIAVETSDYGTKRAEYPWSATHELVIRFDPPATLIVEIPGATHHRYRAQLEPRLYQEDGDNRRNAIAAKGQRLHGMQRPTRGLDSNKYEYIGLTPGTYRFELMFLTSQENGYVEYDEVAQWKFELGSGEVTKAVNIPPLHRVTLLMDKEPRGPSLYVRLKDGQMSRSVQTSEARTVIEGLPAGTWEISADSGVMEVKVDGDVEVAYAPKKYNCMEITAIKEGGELERIGFRKGDKIVAVDSAELADLESGYAHFQVSLTKESTTWTVLRNGNRIDVTFDGKKLRQFLENKETREEFDIRPATRD